MNLGRTSGRILRIHNTQYRPESATCYPSLEVPGGNIYDGSTGRLTSCASGTIHDTRYHTAHGPQDIRFSHVGTTSYGGFREEQVHDLSLTCYEGPQSLRDRKTFANRCVDEIHQISILVDGEPVENIRTDTFMERNGHTSLQLWPCL